MPLRRWRMRRSSNDKTRGKSNKRTWINTWSCLFSRLRNLPDDMMKKQNLLQSKKEEDQFHGREQSPGSFRFGGNELSVPRKTHCLFISPAEERRRLGRRKPIMEYVSGCSRLKIINHYCGKSDDRIPSFMLPILDQWTVRFKGSGGALRCWQISAIEVIIGCSSKLLFQGGWTSLKWWMKK